ncbi:aldehyde dehydrogenase family protein [Candidatus Woesearchaeota archaeon]|nr:MAG: aldehyde dehydrogenase family protein [Candidatus Woesearchaeota archaeon]
MITYKNYVNGEWVTSKSGKTFQSHNPATGEVLGEFQQSTKEDIETAVRAAKQAQTTWARTPAPQRAKILYKAANLLIENKQRLGELVTTEMGKVISEGLGDVQEAIDIGLYMAGEGRRLFGHTTPSELPNKFAMTVRRPIGVVGLITPWNFPIAIPCWKIFPALICGNAVVFKPSSDTPLCAVEVVKIFEKAGLPKGVLNLVTGSGEEVGAPLIEHPDVRGISFTGSKAVGEFVLKHAGIKKVGLELGGKNAIIVHKDAHLDLALEGILFGAYGTTGQRCTACSRVIVHKDVKEKLEKLIVERLKKYKIGFGISEDIDMGPLINHQALIKTAKYVQIGLEEGARMLIGGNPLEKEGGHFFEPTLFTDVKPDMRIAQEEIFGPVLAIIPYEDIEEAFEIANNIEYGLSSAIYTQDVNLAFLAMERIEAGLTYINSSTIGSECHLPFGGIKGTGNGTREAGIEGIHEFSETKTIYVDYSGKLQKAQIDVGD